MPAGSFAGALLVSHITDTIGRKKIVILSGLVWIIGSTLQCAAVVCILLHLLVHILSHRTGPWDAYHWPSYLGHLHRYRIDSYPALSVRNRCTLNPRSPHLDSTMVYHMGYPHPIFHTVRLLLHQWRRVISDSMGLAGNSGRRTFYRHACLPRVSSMVV